MTTVNVATGEITGVYILIGASDRVLYIGASHDVARRVGQHRSRSWWSEVVDVEVYPQPSWSLALAMERALISRLGPKYNIASVDLMEQFVADKRATILDLFAEVPA